MRGDALKSLDPDLAALLAAERRAPAPPAVRRARILARLELLVGRGESGAAAGTHRAATQGTATSLPSSGPATSGSAGSIPVAKAVLVATIAFAVGVGGVVGLKHQVGGSSRAERGIPTARSPEFHPDIIGSNAEPSAAQPLATANVIPVRAPSRLRPVANVAGDRAQADLSVESSMLEQARRALARGDALSALATLSDAKRRFPYGFLIEEREALWIRALVGAGHRETARERARAFCLRFPNSIQKGAIKDALR
jgi:hypothetical protein